MQLLRKSRLISENGIGAVWGQPQEDIIAADAAIRAWRPIQACALRRRCSVTVGVVLVRSCAGGSCSQAAAWL